MTNERADQLVAPSAGVLRIASRTADLTARAIGVRQSYDLRDGQLWPVSDPVAVTGEELFDLASVTKVAATTAVLMSLVDAGEVALDVPAREWLPAYDSTATVRDMLQHQSGLAEWVPTYADPRPLTQRYPVRAGRHYSDLGFMLLADLATAATGTPFQQLAAERVFQPLGMTGAHFRPGGRGLDGPIVATTHGDWIERTMVATGQPYPVEVEPDAFRGWRAYTLVGEVGDGNAWHARGGIAGHAGLFASADDLVALGRGVLASLAGEGLWSPSTVDDFLTASPDPEQAAGFRLWPVEGAAGHGGFTGTGFAVFPAIERVAVLLTNRTHTPIGTQARVARAWADILAEVGAGGAAAEAALWDWYART
ncbi:serine hydrolase domain-containing protein [Fodinicola feengrottensis]|uniref:Serine hydrolase domain-containing protein n=1 Tax=Fodinicola feengrottensis TaxID=435914 RepID=A0ABP4UXW4_9ACTN